MLRQRKVDRTSPSETRCALSTPCHIVLCARQRILTAPDPVWQAKRAEMGVPTDEETQSHVAFVQRALVEGEISDIDLKPNPGVQIKMGFKLAVGRPPPTLAHFGPARATLPRESAVLLLHWLRQALPEMLR